MRDHRRIYGDQVWRLEDDAADRFASLPSLPSAPELPPAPKCGTHDWRTIGDDAGCSVCGSTRVALYAPDGTVKGYNYRSADRRDCGETMPDCALESAPKCGTCGDNPLGQYVHCRITESFWRPCPDCGADDGKESKR